jgi:hypothetical protein
MNAIRKIDVDQYMELVQNLTNDIVQAFKMHVETALTCTQLGKYWTAFIQCAKSYISEFYDMENIPEFVQDRVKYLAIKTVRDTHVITVRIVCDAFKMYKFYSIFNVADIGELMVEISARINDANGKFHANNDTAGDFEELIQYLEEIRALGIEITRFTRFLIMYRVIVQNHDATSLMKRQLFYRLRGEIYLCSWLGTKTSKLDYTGMETLFIEGLTDEELALPEYTLDVYYINMLA